MELIKNTTGVDPSNLVSKYADGSAGLSTEVVKTDQQVPKA